VCLSFLFFYFVRVNVVLARLALLVRVGPAVGARPSFAAGVVPKTAGFLGGRHFYFKKKLY
jgi:hypothetical protein